MKQSALAATATGLTLPFKKSTARPAPSDTVNVALIGCRNKGFGILLNHLDFPDTRCVAMCDVDDNVLQSRAAEIQKTYNQKPKLYHDFRKMLENKDIQAVIIGTPDHWHGLPRVYACQAGMDIYVEKPMANSIEECNVMVKAANQYNRIVQVGQQQRSGRHWHEIMNHIKSGKLGTLRKVVIWANFNYGVGGKKVPDEPVPEGVDYDFWLGPAPLKKTFNRNRFHGSWRMFWDYGGGLMTDWGVHLLDMALWAGDVVKAPEKVLSFGKNLSYFDHAHETFDTMSVVYPLDKYVITWDHTAGTQTGPYDKNYGLRFICDDGSIVANRAGYQIKPEWDNDKKTYVVDAYESDKGRENHDLHSRNFIDCIKSREKPNCPPEIGRQVALCAHMANIAARTGDNMLVWDEKNNRFTNSEIADKYIAPEYRKPWILPKL